MTPEQVARLQKLVSALAHHCLDRMLRRDAETDQQITGRAVDDDTGFQMIVIFAPNQPCRVDPFPLADVTRYEPTGLAAMSEADQAVYEATPRRDQRPASMLAISRRAGYSYCHVRASVRRLIDAGLLVRVTGGIRRAN